MDPLSTTASIIALIQLSSQVVDYVNLVGGAIKERQRLRNEVQACSDVLQQIRDESVDSDGDKAWPEKIEILDGVNGPLRRLATALRCVMSRLQPTKGLIRKAAASLKWPFEVNEVDRIIANIEREKSLLFLAMTSETRTLSREILSTCKESLQSVNELSEFLRISTVENHQQLAELQGAVDRLHLRQDDQETDRTREIILNWLTPIDYASQQNDFFSRRQPGTGQWFLKLPEYEEWIDTPSRTLFCSGMPGAGKTILTSIIVDYLSHKFDGDEAVGISYVYLNFRRSNEQNLADLLLSLLKQLTQQQRLFPGLVGSLYERHKKLRTKPSVDEIWNALKSLAMAYSRIFVVIDALDECESANDCRSAFIQKLLELQTDVQANILATCRHNPEISKRFRGSGFLDIRASDDDIGRYLDANVSSLAHFVSQDLSLQTEIKKKITTSVDGMFLLAKLHLDSLKGKRSPKALRLALAKLGEGADAYDAAYSDAMERIRSQVPDYRELAFEVLSWITCAGRPLKTKELQHALGVEVGESKFDETNLPDLEDLVSSCCGLVTIDQESKVIRLVHYTTQEYFERTQNHWFPDAQSHITKICLTYLSFEAFATGMCYTYSALNDRVSSYPLYDYASCNWGHHARISSEGETVSRFLSMQAQVEACTEVLISAHQQSKEVVFSGDKSFPSEGMTGIHLAGIFGLTEVFTLPEMKSRIDTKDCDGRTALSYAAENGHASAARVLLDNGADVDLLSENGWTPLMDAALHGHISVVRMLLDYGADVNGIAENESTPLSAAAQGNQLATVQLLLERGAKIDSLDYFDVTPLGQAASSGHTSVVQLLLNHGAEIDGKDKFGDTPLIHAAQFGNLAILQLLLDRGAEVDTKGNHGRTPLWNAATRGDVHMVRLLRDRGAHVDSKDCSGRSPLSSAGLSSHLSVMQLLSDSGAEVDSQDSWGQSSLGRAAERGALAAVQWLIEKGAEINRKTTRFPPLLCAIRAEDLDIAQFLLEKGAEIDLADHHSGRTSLSWAVTHCGIDMMQLLLDRGADVDSKDKRGRTPLSWAMEFADLLVVQSLLGRGAEVNVKDDMGRTPLFWGSSRDAQEVSRFLIMDGRVNVNVRDFYGATALSVAARCGREDLVRDLLAVPGIDVGSEDVFGRSCLWWARKQGETNIVECLLTAAPGLGLEEPVTEIAVEESNKFKSKRCNPACTVCFAHQPQPRIYCKICHGGSFRICQTCRTLGARCLVETHPLCLL